MKTEIILVTLAVLLFTEAVFALPYLDQAEETGGDEYNDNIERLLDNTQKRSLHDSFLDRRDDYPIKLLRYVRRSCLRRGDRCDHRPNDCCNNSVCRCNLWGTNCFCERMGLFQQWGK